MILWKVPQKGWYKCNSEGASKENSEKSFITFCIRNDNKELIFVSVITIPDTTSICVEAMTMKDVLEHCVNNLFSLILKTNSLFLKQVLKENRIHNERFVWRLREFRDGGK